MFLVNTKKCLEIFDKVYVSSDDDNIIKTAMAIGALGIKRGEDLAGDVPNIPVYRHAMERMGGCDGLIAVQGNSPTIKPAVIRFVKKLMEMGIKEVMTCHSNYSLYGSVWAMTKERLEKYEDPRKPTPQVLVLDPSIDIHTDLDYKVALTADHVSRNQHNNL